MPRNDPDHRFRAVKVAKEIPEHKFEAELWNHRRGLPADSAVVRAYELYNSEMFEHLQGWLLAGTPADEIERRTGLTENVTKAYRHLFFDETVFRDKFDVIEWARALDNNSRMTATGKQYVRWAIMYGTEAVAYMFGVPTYVDSRTVQEQAMQHAHFTGLMGRDVPITSQTAKESLRHKQLAVQQAALISKSAPPSGNDFALKLKHREMTSSIEVIDQTVEVLS